MNKKELRIKYIKIRRNILNKTQKSIAISNKLFNLKEFEEAKNIGVYSSLPEEVDTKFITEYCFKNNKRVAFPKVNGNEMCFYYVNSLDELENGHFLGIKEPNNNDLANDIDLMIVPGICFDKEKNRIGFGGGYYDKYFSKHTNIFKVGICFDEQLEKEEIINKDDFDVKMDIVITN